MQHGTAREYVIDLIENACAITRQSEVGQALRRALEALSDDDLDEPGVYGPDYGLSTTNPLAQGWVDESGGRTQYH